jgi:hypothetical protein
VPEASIQCGVCGPLVQWKRNRPLFFFLIVFFQRNGGAPMHLISRSVIALMFLVVSIGPSSAQKDDEAARKKRIVEIQKEMEDVQARIAKLGTELGKLQEDLNRLHPEIASREVSCQAIIKKLNYGDVSPEKEFLLVGLMPLGELLKAQAQHRSRCHCYR